MHYGGWMETANEDNAVLIVDDEPTICDLLENAISAWGMAAESVTDPLAALECLKSSAYSVILLDVYMPTISGLDLIPKIADHNPGVKIIIMTGRADKEIVVKAFRLGAFDFLEKPFELEFFSHVLRRAMDARRTELKQVKLIEDLKASQSELTSHKKSLEYLNSQLMETNKALTIFAQNIDREREEVQKRLVLKIRSVIAPVIERLKRDKGLAKYGAEFDEIIRQMIEELTDDLSQDARITSILSFTELRVATLIKNGLTTEEIASQLNISSSTVRTHRKNIRKKLKINNAQYSLKNFLMSKS